MLIIFDIPQIVPSRHIESIPGLWVNVFPPVFSMEMKQMMRDPMIKGYLNLGGSSLIIRLSN